ncbi:MAG TPA: SMP-30/gluconolactonase/LRE family protein [Casimicrobiaceae bacterium]|nr:SMP-30/gluconolactonase/LRE family protein [Casimicrobiaceae bacterium]
MTVGQSTGDGTSPFRCVLDIKAKLGECPQWNADEQALYWVDIEAPTLNRFDPAAGVNIAMPMPEAIGSFAFRKGGGFVVALRSGVWFANAHGRLTRKVADAPFDPAHHRFNDGRCDRQGRFFAGSMNERRDASTGALWRLDTDLSFHEVLGGMTVSNGLAWSPDGRTMYHADTPTRTIRTFDYDVASGTPSGAREFARFPGETDRPDGGTVDAQGCYWTAFFRGGKVLRLSPQGRVLAEHPVPAMCPTMCAFGGPGLSTLYVTTARTQRDEAELARLPLSGGLFAMDVDVPGLPEPSFGG